VSRLIVRLVNHGNGARRRRALRDLNSALRAPSRAQDGVTPGRVSRSPLERRRSRRRARGGEAVGHAGNRGHAEGWAVAGDCPLAGSRARTEGAPASSGGTGLPHGGGADADQERVPAAAGGGMQTGGASAGGLAHAPAHVRESPRHTGRSDQGGAGAIGHASIEMTMRTPTSRPTPAGTRSPSWTPPRLEAGASRRAPPDPHPTAHPRAADAKHGET
jgi:hypothetical protein